MYNKDEKKERKSFQEIFQQVFHRRTKRLLTNVDRLFTNIMWMEIGLSVVAILLNPEMSLTVIGVLFGILIIAFGILDIYAYLKRREIYFFRFYIVYGILGILLGVLTLINPFVFTQVITIWLGLWILYLSILKIDLSFRLKTIGEKSWLTILISAILSVFMSILIFINPFSNILITQLVGAYLILSGILNATNAVLTKNRSIDFLENL